MLSELEHDGFYIKEAIFSEDEVSEIIDLIDQEELENRFGVREFLLHRPKFVKKVFNNKLIDLIHCIAPNCDKSIKSIYFNKPPHANWIVNWHQDLTINLINKDEIHGYKNWRETKDRIVVQPPLEFLENIFTIRIHLDDCNSKNGALRVIKGSHRKGVIDIRDWKSDDQREVICEVKKGGVLIMRPLLLHASKRTENNENRRVLHIEFTDSVLPSNLHWKEKVKWN